MTFTITRLANQQALVKGTDNLGTEGQAVLSTARYDEVKRELAMLGAQETFDETVEELFAPLIEAADTLRAAQVAVPVEDPASYVVVREASTGEASDPGLTLRFDADGTVLNLIESGNSDRLVWVGDALFVTEFVPDPATDGVTLEEATALAGSVLGAEEVDALNNAGLPTDGDLS